MSLVFGFFGFYRNSDTFAYNFNIRLNSYIKYIYSPTIINEDNDKKLSENILIKKFGPDTKIILYEYNKQKHIDKYNKVSNEKFINEWFQQGYRIFSFFYNLSEISKIIKSDNFDPEQIIVLCRIDIGLTINKKINIQEKLKTCDILVTSLFDHCVDDKLFIFKLKHIDVFINLYNDYETYIYKFINDHEDKPISTRPEDIFYYHFKNYNLIINESKKFIYDFEHVCSKYCGHNAENTIA
tara:strand:+ start:2900 stop:3619 length:720 start_codon:yes stop_codon:yes gene_type:complete